MLPDQTDWDVEKPKLRQALGMRMKSERTACGLTLEAAAERSGLAVSTIHKIENGRVSPSYENLVRIARAYDVGIERLISAEAQTPPTTRMTVTRAGDGRHVRTDKFEYEMLCNSLAEKKIMPLVTSVTRRDPLMEDDLEGHAGEEVLFVLSGSIELVVQHYAPVTLETGDCAYFDSMLKHGLRNIGDGDARVFWACTYVDMKPEHH